MKNKILKGLLVAVAAPLALVMGNAREASAFTITSTVNGSSNPNTVFGSSLQNGDFNLTANPGNPVNTRLGDGVDEFTRWVFDFNSDSNTTAFNNAVAGGNEITSALLTMTINANGVSTDSFFGGGGSVGMPTLVNNGIVNSFGNQQTFTIDLMDYGYTTSGIFGELSGSRAANGNVPAAGLNEILFTYQDDVLVSSATLQLTADVQAVPEPTTILGAFAVVGAGGLLRRKKQQDESAVA
ncbi:MAG: PEP-CTERM sorting domain-containing protein [Cyanobacteria bacterium P01_A01_bin.68]